MKKLILTLTFWLVVGLPANAGGKLLIVGGGLSPDNEAVHKVFLDAIPAGKQLAIISAASGTPVQSAGYMKDDFTRYGFDPDRIVHIRLAIRDDSSTEFDESLWSNNGDNADEIARLADVGGVWFTGGDQARILATLKNSDGTDKRMAVRLRAILDEDGIIGGTSAGAAMMSEDMILYGDPLQSLLMGLGPDGSGALGMGKGMGFFPAGLVDQHFDERRRLGRLARAISTLSTDRRLGFGIDENTGFLVDLKSRELRVVGEGSLTVLDGRQAEFGHVGTALSANNLILHVFTDDDSFAIGTGKAQPAEYKRATIGNEYYSDPLSAGGGIAVPYPGVARFLGSGLLDNSGATSLSGVSFTAGGAGVRYIFEQTADSEGFWGRSDTGSARYSITGVRFSIEPVHVSIN